MKISRVTGWQYCHPTVTLSSPRILLNHNAISGKVTGWQWKLKIENWKLKVRSWKLKVERLLERKKAPNILFSASFRVVSPGIEPGTQGFSVLCSTNWAMTPFCDLRVQRYSFFLNLASKYRKKCRKACIFYFSIFVFQLFVVPLQRFLGHSESSAVGSVPRSGRGGREFESPLSDGN